MSHELEIINGEASYVGRAPAWHALGTVTEDLTYAEAMEKGHLANWNVRVVPLQARVGPDLIDVEGKFLTVRDHPGTGMQDALGVVGDDYHAIQNEQSLGVAEHLEAMGWEVHTAGAIRSGRQVFLSMRPKDGQAFILDPDGSADPVNRWLTLASSHDGSMPNTARMTADRVFCANSFDWNLPGAKASYNVRHTATAADRLALAQQLLLRANGYFDKFAEEAAKLLATPMPAKGFLEVATTIYKEPDPESKAAHTRWENKIDLLGDLFDGGGDVVFSNGNIRGTAWAGLNALTERLDHHRTARGGDGTTLELARAGFDPNISAQKAEIRKVVLSWAEEANPAVFA